MANSNITFKDAYSLAREIVCFDHTYQYADDYGSWSNGSNYERWLKQELKKHCGDFDIDDYNAFLWLVKQLFLIRFKNNWDEMVAESQGKHNVLVGSIQMFLNEIEPKEA